MTDDIALQIEVQSSLPSEKGGGRGVVFRTFVNRDCTAHELDDIMDKLRTAVDRQHAFSEIEKWQVAQAEAERLAGLHAQNLEIVQENTQRRWAENNRRGEPRLSASEEAERKGAHANLEHSRRDIEFAKKQQDFYKSKLNGRIVAG